MICKYCGAKNFENSKFCIKCGRGINGEINPSDKNEAIDNFTKDIQEICKRFTHPSGEKVNRDITYIEYEEERRILSNIENSSNYISFDDLPYYIALIATLILVAVFSVLVSGFNYDNENFVWIFSGKNVALVTCSATGFIPFYIIKHIFALLIYDGSDASFDFRCIITGLVAGSICGLVSTLILGLLKGLFGSNFLTVCVVIAIALIIVAAFFIFRVASSSERRYNYDRQKNKVDKLKAEYMAKLNEEIKSYKEKYKEFLTEEDMKKCVDQLLFKMGIENLTKYVKSIKSDNGGNIN